MNIGNYANYDDNNFNTLPVGAKSRTNLLGIMLSYYNETAATKYPLKQHVSQLQRVDTTSSLHFWSLLSERYLL